MPAEPVRAHLKTLAALGMPRSGVEQALGLPLNALRHTTSGTSGFGRGEKITREVGEVVLGFWPKLEHFPNTASIDATGTRRRVEALAVGGWSRAELAKRAGRSVEGFRNKLQDTRLSASLARDVARLYDELWDQRPEDYGVKPSLADRLRRQAQARGFHGPLAWDDELIDNPTALPQTDAQVSLLGQGENLADRFLLGESVILDAAARREVLVHLMEWTDLTVGQVAEQVEMTESAVSRAWERAKAKAREDGRKAPWRRVYIPARELLADQEAIVA
ncbi:hypothetical protein PV516_19360 [Streptomyces scabiei]|uniref:hypothetical protein n=1 Tax=Streptomyces scabiei TaxID=1930 RepID=UPI0029A2F20E|nr:hypothetical protein [Streptomyces scabiei]MDX3165948.1 hypothetical protein [Streptomyces scabiei]